MTEAERKTRLASANLDALLQNGGANAGEMLDHCRESGLTPLATFTAMLMGAKMAEQIMFGMPGGNEWASTLEHIRNVIAKGNMTVLRTHHEGGKAPPTEVMVVDHSKVEKV